MRKNKKSSKVLRDVTISEFDDCIINIKTIKDKIKEKENPLIVMTEHNSCELDYVNWICSFRTRDFS